MERLTQKHDFSDYVLYVLQEQNIVGDDQALEISLDETKYVVGEAIREFGELEDVLEKHNIESVEELDLILQGLEKVHQENADLQHRLEVAEKALELACDYLVSVDDDNDELHKLVKDIFDGDKYLKTKINYFELKAEKELKGEK